MKNTYSVSPRYGATLVTRSDGAELVFKGDDAILVNALIEQNAATDPFLSNTFAPYDPLFRAPSYRWEKVHHETSDRAIAFFENGAKAAIRTGSEVVTLQELQTRIQQQEQGDDLPIVMEAFGVDYDEACDAIFSGQHDRAWGLLQTATAPPRTMELVIYSEKLGVFLGECMGLGFWSKLDPVGQTTACTFKTEAVAKEFLSLWQEKPNDLRLVSVEADCAHFGEHRHCASIKACVAAGLPAWSPEEDSRDARPDTLPGP